MLQSDLSRACKYSKLNYELQSMVDKLTKTNRDPISDSALRFEIQKIRKAQNVYSSILDRRYTLRQIDIIYKVCYGFVKKRKPLTEYRDRFFRQREKKQYYNDMDKKVLERLKTGLYKNVRMI